MTDMDSLDRTITGRLLKAASEVHVTSSNEPGMDPTLILSGFASTSALYEELLASSIRDFWVQNPVILRLCASHWHQFVSSPRVKLYDLNSAAKVAIAQGQGYLALTGVRHTRLRVRFRLTRHPY